MHPIDVDVFIAVTDLTEVVEVQISLGSRLTGQWIYHLVLFPDIGVRVLIEGIGVLLAFG